MESPDDRPETRRGVLKNLAAAGLGAAIATVAARELPPGLGGPATGVPSISGPGTLDAIFNVRDQGAVGDGVADDTGAIIGTIERVPASGGLVYLPRGTYRVTSPIALARTNVWVFGSGPDATVIRLGDGVNADVLTIRASGCTASNLTIDGNKARNASGAGVLVDAAAASEMIENVTVRDLHVVRTKGAGIKAIRPPRVPPTGGASFSRASSTTPTAKESRSSPRTSPSWRTASSPEPGSMESSRPKETKTRSSGIRSSRPGSTSRADSPTASRSTATVDRTRTRDIGSSGITSSTRVMRASRSRTALTTS